MSRQQRFEQAYAEAHDLPIETFQAYRMGDTYRLPGIAKCWRFWNMALDSVETDEPEIRYENGPFLHRENIIEAIEAAGIKIK